MIAGSFVRVLIRWGDMSDKLKKRHRHWAGAVPYLLVALYVAGHFVLVSRPLESVVDVRIYPSRPIMRVYTPLAWIDAHFNRRQVVLKTDADHIGDAVVITP